MKRMIAGICAFAILCFLAYYSSYLISDRYFGKEQLVTDKQLEEKIPEITGPTEIPEVTEPNLSRETAATEHIYMNAPREIPTVEYHYYLIEEFGYVNIYESDMETIYEYTDIAIKDLPQELQDEICTGKGLTSEQELYDFLENYSS